MTNKPWKISGPAPIEPPDPPAPPTRATQASNSATKQEIFMQTGPYSDTLPSEAIFGSLIAAVQNNDLRSVADCLVEGARGSTEMTKIAAWLTQEINPSQQEELANAGFERGNYEFLNILSKAGVNISTETGQRKALEFIQKVIGVSNAGPYGVWRRHMDDVNVKLLTKKMTLDDPFFKEGGRPQMVQVFKLLTMLKNANCDFQAWSGNREMPLESVGQVLNKRLPKTAKYLKITDEPSVSPLAELISTNTARATTKKPKMG